MQLSVDQIRRLLSLFSDKEKKKTFGEIAKDFWALFRVEFRDDQFLLNTSQEPRTPPTFNHPSKTQSAIEATRFALASTLAVLLKDRFNSERKILPTSKEPLSHGFFNATQRLIAIYLLHEFYRHLGFGSHPFLPNFFQILDAAPQDITGQFLESDYKPRKECNSPIEDVFEWIDPEKVLLRKEDVNVYKDICEAPKVPSLFLFISWGLSWLPQALFLAA